ncbi:hypothetical protein B296_00048744 [Ensete ventricosum]|uniref:histidine kinase n=1 Tax=Ensete ventricosum TaxID=4639 RepID=A0A426YTL3_ENSVE|nr:hypothetical protein B296_00048744 [Ensete ventricosum]
MSIGVAVIVLLIGHIFHAALNRIEEVEDDYRQMRELKVQAEAADIAKSQMLMDTDLDATQQDFAMTAQSSGKALIALINEVLDQAKIESGRLELEAVPFDLRDVLDNVLSLFSDKSQAKGIEFTEMGHIFVSVDLVEEVKSAKNVLCETLSGFHVVDKQKIWENFTMFKSSTEGNDAIDLMVTVEDTGVGIPQDAQSRIFTPFMQADSSTSRTYGGTGIGLSISKCLVDLMGGEIGFVSKPGIGSTFSFTAVFRQGCKNAGEIKRHYSDPTSSDFQGMRGLVADGRSIRARILKYHLQRLGIHIDIVTNQDSALCTILDPCSTR